MATFFRNINLIMKRDLKSYFYSPFAYVIIALVLVVDAVFFYAWALRREELTLQVIKTLFYIFSGTTMIASTLITMRLFTEEIQAKTMEMLYTAPLKDSEIVLGKYISSLIFFLVILLLSFNLPLFVYAYGEVSFGQILSGYLGTVLLAMASLSIGIFTSSITKSQIISAITAGGIIVVLLLSGSLGNYIGDPNLSEVITNLSLFVHFRDFEKGVVNLKDIIFMLSVTVFFLYLTTKIIESRRWK